MEELIEEIDETSESFQTWAIEEYEGRCKEKYIEQKRRGQLLEIYKDEIENVYEAEKNLANGLEEKKRKELSALIDSYDPISASQDSQKIADYLSIRMCFLNAIETDVLYSYDDYSGSWKEKGEQIVKHKLKELIPNKYTSHIANEVIDNIRARYMKSVSFFQEDDKNRYINLKNGVFDLKAQLLLPHSPKYKFLYCLPVVYNPSARCEKIIKFLTEIFADDYNKVITALEIISYCLIKGYQIQKAFFLVGIGANGKTTFNDLVRRFLGEGNTTSLSIKQLTNDKFMAWFIFGKLANITSETPNTYIDNIEVFKRLTGSDRTTADRKYKDQMEFKNTAKIIIAGNSTPLAPRGEYAFYRRWHILEFGQRFEGQKDNKNIINEITTEEELSGLFNIIVGVFLPKLLSTMELSYGKEVEETEKEYQKKVSPANSFIIDCIEDGPEGSLDIDEKDVYNRFKEYCNAIGIKSIPKKNRLTKTMKAFGYDKFETTVTLGGADKKVWKYSGIKLNEVPRGIANTVAQDSRDGRDINMVIGSYADRFGVEEIRYKDLEGLGEEIKASPSSFSTEF